VIAKGGTKTDILVNIHPGWPYTILMTDPGTLVSVPVTRILPTPKIVFVPRVVGRRFFEVAHDVGVTAAYASCGDLLLDLSGMEGEATFQPFYPEISGRGDANEVMPSLALPHTILTDAASTIRAPRGAKTVSSTVGFELIGFGWTVPIGATNQPVGLAGMTDVRTTGGGAVTFYMSQSGT
jgi:hypothetical protein